MRRASRRRCRSRCRPEDEAKLRLQRLRGDLSDPKEFASRFGFPPVEDRPLRAAIDVLRGAELFRARNPPPAEVTP